MCIGSSSSTFSSSSSQMGQSTSISGKYRADLNTLKQSNTGLDFNYTEEIEERDYKGKKIFRAYALFHDGGKIENKAFYSNKKDSKDVYLFFIIFLI